jgi:polyisoprenoid-binding protein YceI
MTRLKSTLLALSLLIASPVFAQTPDITGDWDVTVTSPQGTNTTPVSFKQEGGKVSGMFKSPQGTLPFEGGTMTGSDLKFTFTINAQGMELPITLTGKVEGETITGKADFGGFAEGDWSAKRSGATPTATAAAAAPAAAAPAAPAPATAAATGVGFGGKWDVMLKTPAGDMPANATLSVDNGKLSGTFGSQLGEVPVSGTADGKMLMLTIVAQTPQGEMTVTMTGDLDGDNIVNGKAEVAGLGQMEWSAKRVKQ